MARVHRTPLAEQDYLGIWHYIAADHPEAADRLLRTFDAKLRLIAEYPGMGKPRDEFLPGLRGYAVGNYILFYTQVPDGIRLLRVLHGAQDLGRFFRSG